MSTKLITILAIFFLATTAQAELPVDCKANQTGPFVDLCVHETAVSRMITIDLKIKEEHARQEDVLIDIPYGNIRRSGVVMQVYYNSAVGKAQWVSFSDAGGIYLMPSSILLPVKRWILQGLAPGRIVRIVLLFGE